MEIECKMCGKVTGLLKGSQWFHVEWTSPEGKFEIEKICPSCALILDEELQRTFQKVKKKRGKIKG